MNRKATIWRWGATLMVVMVTLTALSSPALAAWPEDQPITMIVAYAPGGATDIVARLAASYIEKYLGQSVVVVNRPGAGGEIGFTALATAKKDGYTIGFINTPNVLTIPIERKTAYQLESLIPVANLMDDPDAFLVRPDSPFHSLADVAAYARQNPGKLTYGTSGIGSDDHIAGQTFANIAGARLRHIPFDGAAPNRTALLGGHIMLGVFNISEAKEFVETGQLRILGQMSDERTELFPDVPTFREQGFDIVMGSQRGIALPAGTPAQIVDRLSRAVEQAINDPDFRRRANEAYLPLRYLGPADYLGLLEQLRTGYMQLWQTDPWVASK